jgi:hypothetical protein
MSEKREVAIHTNIKDERLSENAITALGEGPVSALSRNPPGRQQSSIATL